MTAPQKTLLLFMFLATAGFRVALGSTPDPIHPVTADMIAMPDAPPGWTLEYLQEPDVEPGVAAKTAIYHAPDGTSVALYCQAAWPDRRSIPVSFYPNECAYLGKGWDFEVRDEMLPLGPGAAANRIVVRQDQLRRLDIAAYACDGVVIGSWHDFKSRLIWQRIRRQRKPWLKAAAITSAAGQGASNAPTLLLNCLRTSALRLPPLKN